MAYDFLISEEYCVEVAWFYCASTNVAYDPDHFYQALQLLPGETEEGAITRLVVPLVARLGFPVGSFAIHQITDDYLAYDGCSILPGDFLIFFNDDVVRKVVEKFPDSMTYEFSEATKQLVKILDLDHFESTTLLSLRRLEQHEHDDDGESQGVG